MKAINLQNYIIFLALSLTTLTLSGQEGSENKFNFSGSIDAYYRANLNAPNAGANYTAPGSSFAQLPGFALGMANLVASYSGDKVGFVGDLVFGPRGTDAIFASPLYSSTGNIVNQLFVYWNVTDKLTLTFGNFNTFLGYEVIAPAANFNYSTSYLFSYGPFSHTGLRADFALSEDWSLMLSVMNPTDLTEFNPTGSYAYGVQLGYKGQFFNLLADDGAVEVDYTGGFNLSEAFYLGINAAYFDAADDTGFAGAALYPQYQVSDKFTMGLRGEYFIETGDFGAIGTGVEDSSVVALTLTGSATIGNLILKPELRLDSASEDAFLNDSGEPINSLAAFVFAAIYAF